MLTPCGLSQRGVAGHGMSGLQESYGIHMQLTYNPEDSV